MRTERFLITAILLLTGCAARQPVTANWRLTNQGSADLLIPPGVVKPDLAKRTVAVELAAGHGRCPSTIRVKPNRLLVTVSRDMLLNQPQGWLTTWAADLEKQDCIARGEAAVLAARIDESLPLVPAVAYSLLYPKDLIPPVHFEVVSPILRDTKAPDEPIEVAGSGSTLNVTVKSSANLIGFEKALYAVEPRSPGPGFEIVPLRAERHIDRQIEQRTLPETNYFRFPPEAAFFRLIVKSDQTDFTALVVAAPTRAELDRRTALLDSSSASCATLNNELCIAIPRRVAINAVVPVTVNGNEVMALWGTDLGSAIRAAGDQPENVLSRLSVSRPYNGRPIPMEFDRSNRSILRLPLMGGEVISWSR